MPLNIEYLWLMSFHSAFGGLIAFGVQQASTSIANWRLLFIVEGIPSVLLGIMTIFLLPDRPEETPFLNEKERRLQLERMNRGISADVGRTVNKGRPPVIVVSLLDKRFV